MRQKSIHLHSTIILPFKICIHPSLDTSSHERRTNDYSFQSCQNTTFNIFSSGTWSTGGVMAGNVLGSVFFESTERIKRQLGTVPNESVVYSTRRPNQSLKCQKTTFSLFLSRISHCQSPHISRYSYH